MKLFNLLTFLISFINLTLAITAPEVSKIRKKQKKSIINLKNSNYQKILNGPRDFSVVVLLTASNPQVGCLLCSQFDPDFTAISNSWVNNHPNDDNLFFAKADFNEGSRKIFENFNVNSVPKLYFFKPTNESIPLDKGFEEYRFIEGDQIYQLTKFIEERTGNLIKVVKPVNYGNLIFSSLVTIGFIGLIIKYRSKTLKIVTSKQLWGGVIILGILLFITGYMFNQIRGTQYIGQHQNGNPDYFRGGQQDQFAIETNILSSIYGVMTILMIILIKTIPSMKNQKANTIATFITVFLLFFIYSLLVDIFAKKSYGYPYRLLNLFNF